MPWGLRSRGEPQDLEHVGSPGLAGRGPASVLQHPGSAAGRDDSRHRADVHCVCAIAPGADQIEQTVPVNRYRNDVLHQCIQEAQQLLRRLPLAAESDQESRHLRLLYVPESNFTHGPPRLSCGEIIAIDQAGQQPRP